MNLGLKKMMIAALATATVISCNREEPLIEGSYEFYEPILTWNIGRNQVMDQMKDMKGWKEDKDNETGDELCYISGKTNAEIRYSFVEGGLHGSSVTYYGCNEKFEKMKNDWTKKLGLSWKDQGAFFEASYSQNHCSVTVQKNVNCGIEYMIIDFTYSEFLF